jgi:hypothetical protein
MNIDPPAACAGFGISLPPYAAGGSMFMLGDDGREGWVIRFR